MRSAPTTPPVDNHGPEFRCDPVSGRWVVVALDRALRPMASGEGPIGDRVGVEQLPCPFCTGQEHDTPNEVFALRETGSQPNGPGWRLRVVPNRFPAVWPAADWGPTQVHWDNPSPLLARCSGIGRHEVVIESADHITNPALLPDDLFRNLFATYRERMVALATDPTVNYAAVFKNVGTEAGASLGHTHSQIIATPFVPDLIACELRGADDHYRQTGRCLFCDLVARERADQTRVVAETAGFVAVAAFAPRFGYEVWVLSIDHASRYESLTDTELADLAGLMKRVVQALDRALGEPPYNWFLHTSPLRTSDSPAYHWHFEIVPRTSRPAGFEWGAGCFVTTVAPESAAAHLRAVDQVLPPPPPVVA